MSGLEPINKASSQMTEAELRAVLDTIYAEIDHAHTIAQVTGLQTELDGIDTALAALTTALDGKAPTSHTHPYLPLSGGTLTGTMNFPGNGRLDTPGGDAARLFAAGAGGLYLQANAGPASIRAAGTECLDVYPTGYVTIQNPTSNDTRPTLELIERGTQVAPLLKAGPLMVSKNGEVKSSAVSSVSNPTTSNFASGTGGWWKNTTLNEVRYWYNDGGTMLKSAALTT